ncbi:flagellar hook-associated protein FlgL [Desulfovibrio sp. JC010]|uniref:flagellar hook-associated protein FlgL n=1 Tax=Desulfovibrio sp. JC010 TaxID=2593641 RepID=UPI0013D57B4A|nr:flagellar hook-associated protein FlgL [Desulfovibrio sp. JC010]NDV25217.1 flagellar hook-associated protein 3 [Desulfovibrio sp. JC010]
MRVSTSQIYDQSMNNVTRSLSDYLNVNEQVATQKKLNAPSDDPAGMGNVVNLRSYDQTLESYYNNTEYAGSLLGTADGLLSEASEVMISVKEQVEQGSTGTYTDDQQQSMAVNMIGYQDAMLAIANAELGDDYLFSGESTDTAPYEYVPGVTVTGDSPAESDFVSFTGSLDDPVIVEFTSDGTIGTDAVDYRYSLDGGNSWLTGTMDGTATPPDTTMELGDVSVEMNAGTAVTAYDSDDKTGGQFVVRNSMQYNGADEAMAINISESTELEVNSVGSDIFGGIDPDTGEPFPDPNMFEAMSDSIAYMWIGDEHGTATTLETIDDGYNNMLIETSNVGAREEKADFTGQSLELTRERVASAISDEEDADSAELSVELSRAEYIYNAVLSSTSNVISMSIMNYL